MFPFRPLQTGVQASAEVTPAEDAAELEVLAAQFTAYFHPNTPEERALGDIAIRNEWVLRRMARLEANYWRLKDHESKFISELRMDASFVVDSNFTRIQWRINSAQRNLYSAVDRLRVLRKSRKSTAPKVVIYDVESFTTPAPAARMIEGPAPLG